MKKSLLALAVLGAFAGAAQAQTSVTIYGQMDVGITKSTGGTTSMNAGDNNKLGFKGTEDLGGGLGALFQAEIRFDPNTGKTEGNGARPLFQGSTVVGLTGGFGTLRLGRALPALQVTAPAFDPWGATRNRGAFHPDTMQAGYNTNPLEPTGTMNRFSNGIFYTTPSMSGFQGNLSIQTKQAQDAGTPTTNAFSAAGTYNNGPIGLGVAYERNAISDKIWLIGGSFKIGSANLMASYANASDSSTTGLAAAVNAARAADAKAWNVGATVDMGTGNFLVGYGKKDPDAGAETKKFAVGYEHKLSKRTFLYADAIHRKVTGASAVKTFDVGIHHNF